MNALGVGDLVRCTDDDAHLSWVVLDPTPDYFGYVKLARTGATTRTMRVHAEDVVVLSRAKHEASA